MALSHKTEPIIHLPLMQIIRPGNGNVSDQIIFNNSLMMKPKPTGYLNVYEYELPPEQYQINPGDVLKIFWNSTQQNSLVYRTSNASNKTFPLVSIIIGDCGSEAYLNLTTVYCSDITTGLSTSDVSFTGTVTKGHSTATGIKTSNQSMVATITGGIVSCIILSSFLIILLIIVVIVIRRRRKLASTLSTTSITESSRAAIDQGGTYNSIGFSKPLL